MRRRNAFTLIELLVVIAIIGILAAIIFPVYAQAKKGAYRSSDISNMNALRTAIQLYKADGGAYPPALLGYVGPYQNTVDGLGANVLPPNSIRDAIYPKRVESLAVFRPALDRVPDNQPGTAYNPGTIEGGTNPLVTAATWPAAPNYGQSTASDNSSGTVRQRFGPTDGFIQRASSESSGCVARKAYYYRISGYDVAPVVTDTKKMESHYQLFWSGWTVPVDPCNPTADESGNAGDTPRQLGYTDPPETTVVTWNPFFRDYTNGTPIHQKQDLVLFLAGNARPMDSADMAKQGWQIKP